MKVLLICRSSRPQMFYKVGVLKNFAKFRRKHQRRSLFNEVVRWTSQAYNFIKKETPELQNSCGRLLLNISIMIYQNINCLKVSVSKLIISKSYKEAGRRGRSKLLLPTHINYQSFTLVKG